jgi:capsule polysaccharide export protein KpsC/LpsZ
MAIIVNRRIAAVPHLASFLADHPRAVAGWGRKPSGRLAGLAAALLRRPPLWLEDGFLRSIGRDEPPLSLILDETGVYYDARRPSDMERAIARNAAAGEGPRRRRARALAELWRRAGLSKYNHQPELAEAIGVPYVLVADQCRGDLSLAGGLAGWRSCARFDQMVQAALDEHPDCMVLIKTHPDHLSHGRAGLLRAGRPGHPRLRVLATPCHPARLVAGARAIYTLTSLLGFEGLIWGRPVRCFAMPFYAGWGLTQDTMPAPARRAQPHVTAPAPQAVDLADLVHAALIDLPRYVDPRHGTRWSAEDALGHAARRLAARRGTAAATPRPAPGPVDRPA